MRRRFWLIALCLYAVAGIIDTADRLLGARRAGQPLNVATLSVAFCAGLFWPLDVAARPLLGSR